MAEAHCLLWHHCLFEEPGTQVVYERTILAGCICASDAELAQRWSQWLVIKGQADIVVCSLECLDRGIFDKELNDQWGSRNRDKWSRVSQHSSKNGNQSLIIEAQILVSLSLKEIGVWRTVTEELGRSLFKVVDKVVEEIGCWQLSYCVVSLKELVVVVLHEWVHQGLLFSRPLYVDGLVP